MTDGVDLAGSAAVPAAPAAAPAIKPEHLVRSYIDSLKLFLAHWRGSLIAITLITLAVTVAGQDHAPLRTRVLWCACACAMYLGQALMSWWLERAGPTPEAAARGVPWLVFFLAIGSITWGLVPWIVADASTHVLLFACIFNAMVCFSVVNAPGTRAMVLCAVGPLAVLTSAALLAQPHLRAVGAGFAAVFLLIVFYGLRVQAAIVATMCQRYNAEDLTGTLRQQQRRLIQLERDRTLLLERQRLMRDMHDGLGSSLSSSLVAVESGALSSQQLAQLLRECVDDLRVVIDSLEPVDGDLVALLASLRFRLERRLAVAGVLLEWDMQDLPPLAWMGAPEALQVMRTVQEALANVVKHAGPCQVQVSARLVNGEVEVRVADDGLGYDMAVVSAGRGLRSMKQRALQLGAALDISARVGQGSTVLLRLPVSR